MNAATIPALIDAADTLAAMLQTLRQSPTAEHAHRVTLHLYAMAHEADRLTCELAKERAA